MPIYEYTCPKCGEFEITQRITEPPLKRCPTCRSGVKKLISQTSFQLKGSGWYVTDYARKSGGETTEGKGSKTEATKTESGSKSESTSSSDGKSSSESTSASKGKSRDRGTKAAA